METGLVGHHGLPAGKVRKAGPAHAVDPPLEGVRTVSAKLKRPRLVRMSSTWITYGEKDTSRLKSINSTGPQNMFVPHHCHCVGNVGDLLVSTC